MICVDPLTGIRSNEPLSTLAIYRKVNVFMISSIYIDLIEANFIWNSPELQIRQINIIKSWCQDQIYVIKLETIIILKMDFNDELK
jgi:hypothetical protein